MSEQSAITQYKLSLVNVKDVMFSPYNPRKITPKVMDKLKASLKEFGLVDPIVVNKRNMNVVGGNQRLAALKDFGVEKVTAIIVDLDDSKERALNVALNKISGEWDFEKLKEIMSQMDEVDQILTGFDTSEIELLAGSSEEFNVVGEDNAYETGPVPGNEQPEEASSNANANGDGVSYIVYISFKTKEAAELFLAEQGVAHEYKGSNRTFVWRKE